MKAELRWFWACCAEAFFGNVSRAAYRVHVWARKGRDDAARALDKAPPRGRPLAFVRGGV